MRNRDADDRGSWYLLTGLVIGVILGIVYAWVLWPIEYINTAPASLRPDFKAQYRALAASAYLASGNLERAKTRLEVLKDGDMTLQVSGQAAAWMDGTHPESEVRGLNLLAAALQQGPLPTLLQAIQTTPSPTSTQTGLSSTPVIILTSSIDFTATPTPTATRETPTVQPKISLTPAPTITPLPTRTPTSTPGGAFVLQKQEFICNPNLTLPYLQIEVMDAGGAPVPGVEIIVLWDGGEDHFFTGLKPDLGLGYADFVMSQGVTYNLRLAAGGTPVSGITATECEAPGAGRIWGSWYLSFSQP